jgi:hypothetical protein
MLSDGIRFPTSSSSSCVVAVVSLPLRLSALSAHSAVSSPRAASLSSLPLFTVSHAGCDEERRDDESMSAHFHDTVSSWYAFQEQRSNNDHLTHASITSHDLKRGKPSIHVFPHLQVAVTLTRGGHRAWPEASQAVLEYTCGTCWGCGICHMRHADRRLRQDRLRHIS